MELKDFIKGTIKDISEAITELNEEIGDTGLLVNPKVDNHLENTRYAVDGMIIQDIEFNLQVSASEKTDAGGGIHINVLKAGLSNTTDNATVSTIQFKIAVSLPTCVG